MDRNLVLAVALSVGVYAAWFGFLEKRFAPPVPAVATVAGSPAASPAGSSSNKAAGGAAAPSAPAAVPAPALDAGAALAEAEEVMFGDAAVKVQPRGAAIVSFLYPEPLGKVELVDNPAAGLFSTFPDLSFKRDKTIKNGLAYTALRGDGLKITKEYLPGRDLVLPRTRVTVFNTTRRPLDAGPWTLSVGPGLNTIASEQGENKKLERAVALTPEGNGLNGRVETLKPGEHAGPYRWIGIDNRYFLVALMPAAEHFAPARAGGPPPSVTLTAKPVTVGPGGSFTWEIPFYLGAKGHTWLSRYGVGLERAIDFGFFSQLGRAMLMSLEKIHQVVGNWGWSIVVLTLCLQVLLFPLTWKSLRAAAAMKKLQPEIAKIQQRYADDPTKMNAEMMELYKKGGANPLGGCLPMILQMPIFIALFNTLRGSWELHGAGWILWIRDLSAMDPYYALPIIMGGLMFVQSKLNPPAGDPAQQKVMMFMPLIFTFMFLKFPSGLVLYWLTNSIVSTALQLGFKKRLEA